MLLNKIPLNLNQLLNIVTPPNNYYAQNEYTAQQYRYIIKNDPKIVKSDVAACNGHKRVLDVPIRTRFNNNTPNQFFSLSKMKA